MSIAFIFPGQGAQYVGMGKDFYESFPQAKKVYDQASEFLGYDLSGLAFNGPEQVLTKTKHSQVAIFVNSVAILSVILKLHPELTPKFCAGLSLGEYTALYASGKITFLDCLALVQKRAQFMNDACEEARGAMSAVLGKDGSFVSSIINEVKDVWVANCNCPNQVVISGTVQGVDEATLLLKDNGVRKIIPLKVHGAFHSGLMQKAQDRLASFIDQTELTSTDISVPLNVTGGFAHSLDEIKKGLKNQVTHSVLWEKSIRSLETQNIDLYIEIGCGKTLAGMNKKIGVNGKTISIDCVEDLETLKTHYPTGEHL